MVNYPKLIAHQVGVGGVLTNRGNCANQTHKHAHKCVLDESQQMKGKTAHCFHPKHWGTQTSRSVGLKPWQTYL